MISLYWLIAISSLLLALTATDFAQAALIDDFNDGTDENWRGLLVAGAFDYDASSGSYVISRPASRPTAEAGAASWIPSEDDGKYADGTIQATVQLDTSVSCAMIGMRASISPDGTIEHAGYAFAVNNLTERIYISRTLGSMPGDLVSAPFSLTEGQDYIIEGSAFGPELSMTIWPADEAKPEEPQLTFSDNAYQGSALWVSTYHCPDGPQGDVSAQFDDIYFSVPEPISGFMLLVGFINILVFRRLR